MRYEKAAIHKVFRLFHNFSWAKIFCPNPQKRVFRGYLQFSGWLKKQQRERGINKGTLTKNAMDCIIKIQAFGKIFPEIRVR